MAGTPSTDFDVVIAGGGLVGLSGGLALARAGLGAEALVADQHHQVVGQLVGLRGGGDGLEGHVGRDVLAVERALEDVVPADYALHAHHWLILHGRYVCKARRPECERCIIADLCEFPSRTASQPAALPLRESAR